MHLITGIVVLNIIIYHLAVVVLNVSLLINMLNPNSSVLYETLAGNFMGVTQYDESSKGLDLETACKILLDKNSGLTAFDRYANLSSRFLNVS